MLSPLASIGYWQMPADFTGITDPLSWQAYPFLLGLGVAWFIALLLIFNFGYAIWRRLTRSRTATPKSSTPSYLGIGIFILALALLSYLVRIVIPIGKEVFDFPTLGYLPQYLTLFIVGIVAYRRNWFRTTPGSMGIVGFVTALVATVLLFPLALSGNLFSLEVPEVWVFLGGGTFLSGVYALWDSIFVVGMCLAAITFFRRFFNQESSFGSFLAQQSYAVYIIHVPIIVFIGIALKGVQSCAHVQIRLAGGYRSPDLLHARLPDPQNSRRVEGSLNRTQKGIALGVVPASRPESRMLMGSGA